MKKLSLILNKIKKSVYLDKKITPFVDIAINHIEFIKNQKCEDCKYFSSGKQPDGIGWEDCEWNYHCSVPLENMFASKDK